MSLHYTIYDLQDYAEKRGGKCLSKNFEGSKIEYLWECGQGHQWSEPFSKLKSQDKWCLKCAREKKNIPKLQELKDYAASKGGTCLSDKFIDTKTRYLFECDKGHQWTALENNILKQQTWCPHCNSKARLSLEDLQKLAAVHGGKCLAEEYVGILHTYEWECKEGHKWTTFPTNIKEGKWCPQCTNWERGPYEKIDLERLKKFAEDKGGKLLSETFPDRKTRLEWECDKGHKWTATIATVVYAKSWCPQCSNKPTVNIEEFQEAAHKRGGVCLTQEYLNAKTYLEFECSKGHLFKALPRDIKKGSWCKQCLRDNKIQVSKTKSKKYRRYY